MSELYHHPDEIARLLRRFQDFLENDGRHHLWICAPDLGITLVYDQHNVIYAYGRIVNYRQVLVDKGFQETKAGFNDPVTSPSTPGWLLS